MAARKRIVVFKGKGDSESWYWQMRNHQNGQILADGAEGYATRSNAIRAVRSVFSDGYTVHRENIRWPDNSVTFNLIPKV